MDDSRLTKELISDPSMWRLMMEINEDALDVVIYSIVEDNSLLYRRIPFAQDKSKIVALEEAIYDNPLLLGDFGKVDVLINNKSFTIIPASVTGEDTYQDIMSVLWPGDSKAVLSNQLSSSGETLLMSVDMPILAFVQRTFPGVRVMHRITPIITYFYNKDRLNNASRMYVHLDPKSLDIVYISNGQIKLANTFETPTDTDMLYYIMSVAQSAGMNLKEDEMMLCGQPAQRESMARELRKYVSYVMPVIFPSSMYHGGKDAMEAPYELILLPLCE